MNEQVSIRTVVREEWRELLQDRRLLMILIVTPVIYAVMFGFLYAHQRITDIPVTVYDGDHSQLSRQIIQAFDATDTFNVVQQMNNEQDVMRQVETGGAKVGLIIPDQFSARLKHGENVPVMTIIDGSNMMYSNSASRIANQVVSSISAGVAAKTLEMKGFNADQVSSTFSTIPFRSRVLFNPTYNYKLFMPLGVLSAALQQCLLLGIALSCTRDKERGTWMKYANWRFTPWKLAVAKLAPYYLAGTLNVVTVFGLSALVFDIPFKGQLLPFALVSLLFNFALCGIGFLFSMVAKTRLDATQMLMLFAVPAFMLSGYTWPLEAMPAFLRGVAHILPLTYYVDAVRSITLKGLDMVYIMKDVFALGLIGLVCLLLSFIVFPLQFRKERATNVVGEQAAMKG